MLVLKFFEQLGLDEKIMFLDGHSIQYYQPFGLTTSFKLIMPVCECQISILFLFDPLLTVYGKVHLAPFCCRFM